MEENTLLEMTPGKFSAHIKNIMIELGMGCMDAVLYWCEKNDVDIEYAAGMIKRNMVMFSAVQDEASSLNFLKKSGAKLPL